MTKPKIALITCKEYPELEPDDAGLVESLADANMDPVIVAWDDPNYDWSTSRVNVVRSVRDYAPRRDEFLAWTRRVPRLLNHPDVMEWNSDKHYLIELEKRGIPVVPTTWLEPHQGLDKQRVHSRFPAGGDFVVKPAVSSGARDLGRYTANKTKSRMDAILHSMHLLDHDRTVMVQRYIKEVDTSGELSLIYFNGLLSHVVEKKAMLAPLEGPSKDLQKEKVTTAREATKLEWEWGETMREVLHGYVKERLGHDLAFLFTRFDVVPDGTGSFYLMEVSLIDASLYLSYYEPALANFVDAISTRVFW